VNLLFVGINEDVRDDIDESYAAYDARPVDEIDSWGDLAAWRQEAGASLNAFGRRPNG
jgi:hypothetical protein